MRIRMAFLCCTVVAMAALLAPTAALATGWHSSCSTFNPTVTILLGPCPLDISGNGVPTGSTVCAASGDSTGIKYKISGTTLGSSDHAATVVTANNTVVPQTGFTESLPGVGDNVTGLGKHSQHEKTIRVNPNSAAAGEFWVIVTGSKSAIPASVVVKKGSCTKSFAIDGLGYDEPEAPVTETLTHEGCSVEFTMNALTGTVIKAKLTQQSLIDGCNSPDFDSVTGILNPRPASVIEVKVDGINLQGLVYGNGLLQSGTTSCTTKIVGGKVYTYGKPCP